jgi:hypothetical protein
VELKLHSPTRLRGIIVTTTTAMLMMMIIIIIQVSYSWATC